MEQAILIEPRKFNDERGCFYETFKESDFENFKIKQINESVSRKGVLRGLHFQRGEHAQAKMVRCLKGAIFDVAVDLRKDSPSYGQCTAVYLSGESGITFYIPRGFAHGFLALEDNTKIQYFCDNEYNKESEGGVAYDDPMFRIGWPEVEGGYIMSDKDKKYEYISKFNKVEL